MIIYLILLAIHKITRTASDNEAELMGKIANRDIQALESIYDMYSGLVFSLIRSILKDKEAAEDLLQEIFIQIWEKAHLFDASRGNVCQWIIRMARNRSIDILRSRKYQTNAALLSLPEEDHLSPKAEQSDPLDATIMKERSEQIKNALGQLSSEQREVIEKAYFGGYKQSEIANMLNIPLGTVKTRIRLGLLKLESILTEVTS